MWLPTGVPHLVYDHQLFAHFINHAVRELVDHGVTEVSLALGPGRVQRQAPVAFVQDLLEAMPQAGLLPFVLGGDLPDLFGGFGQDLHRVAHRLKPSRARRMDSSTLWGLLSPLR